MVALLNTPELPRNTVICGDCLAVLKEMPDCSVDAIVTDPPAGIGFMGVGWDTYGEGKGQARTDAEWDCIGSKEHPRTAQSQQRIIAKQGRAFRRFMTEVFTEALRVIRPGGHAFVWALPRTSHWTATALEDAGWEIREVVVHLFGSGFPKSHNISAAIDKLQGDEREVIGKYDSQSAYDGHERTSNGKYEKFITGDKTYGEIDITAPATPEAARYAGYGSALKPSNEHWILCRKPLSEPTIAQNVLVHGTGGLNIDATRIGTQDNLGRMNNPGENGWKNSSGGPNRATYDPVASSGRWPSNTLFSHTPQCRQTGVKRVRGSGWRDSDNERPFDAMFDGGWKDRTGNHYTDPDGMEIVDAWECDPSCPVRILGEQSGISKSKAAPRGGTSPNPMSWGDKRVDGDKMAGHNDEGTAARYFAQFSPLPDELEVPYYYCSKASKSERNKGCEDLKAQQGFDKNTSKMIAHVNHETGKTTYNEYKPSVNGNSHPTVKPLSLLKYLITLISPPGGIVLDMFAGSGSTGVAAIQTGHPFILVEQSLEYVEIARARIAHALQEAGIAEVQGDGEWECHESCPIRILGEQSGVRKSGALKPYTEKHINATSYQLQRKKTYTSEASEGTAARYFAQFAPDSLWAMLEDEGSEYDQP